MKGKEVIDGLKKKFRLTSDTALAKRLGITGQAIQNWKNRPKITARQIAGLVNSAGQASSKTLEATAIRPLVEFFRIEKCKSRQEANYELFSVKTAAGRDHPYLAGLRNELRQHHGIYIFFDSRGRAIYTGKARAQSLWKEMNLAFNRDRGEVQKIKRVRHPKNMVQYRTTDEKVRQIDEYLVPLHDLTAYFSAYRVVDGMINVMEAMLVRSFANDLLNVRMERFSQHKKRKPKRGHRRRA